MRLWNFILPIEREIQMNENNIVSREEILKTLNELKVVLSKDGCTTKLKIMKKSIIEMPEKRKCKK